MWLDKDDVICEDQQTEGQAGGIMTFFQRQPKQLQQQPQPQNSVVPIQIEPQIISEIPRDDDEIFFEVSFNLNFIQDIRPKICL